MLAAQPNVSDVLLAGTDTGIFRTTNGGGVWEKVYPQGANVLREGPISLDEVLAKLPGARS